MGQDIPSINVNAHFWDVELEVWTNSFAAIGDLIPRRIVVTLLAKDRPSGAVALWARPDQLRQLRLALSRALEGYYREHPEELGADIEADLTMDLVPDLEPSSEEQETPTDRWWANHGLTDAEVQALAALWAHGRHHDGYAIPGVRSGRVSLRTLSNQCLITLCGTGADTGWELTELGRDVYRATWPEGVSVDEAVQRG